MKKKRTFRKFTDHGVDLNQFLDMTHEQLIGALPVQDQEEVLPWPRKNTIPKGVEGGFLPLNDHGSLLVLSLT